MAKKHGKLIEKQARAGCEKWSLKAPFKSMAYKRNMMACKAKAAIKGLNASAGMAKKLSSHCSADDPMRQNDCKKKIFGFLTDIKDDIKEEQAYANKKI